MRIAVDLTSLSYHITGIERFALCITKCILLNDKKNEYILVFREEVYKDFIEYQNSPNVRFKIIRGSNKYVFNILTIPLEFSKLKADKYLFMAFASPILFMKKGIITTIHDMAPWDCPQVLTFKQKLYCRLHGRISCANSEIVLTVSNFSKERIHSILGVTKEKIKVVYSAISDSLSIDNEYDFEMIKEKYNLPDKYIMTLSTLEPRKNMLLLLEAFTEIKDRIDYDLVLVGRKGWKMDEVIEKYNNDGRIHITGFVDDEDVVYIYKNAMCFVFPTLYEGFGLPPVEALFVGTPVISSDAASMPEILRKQAVYFKNNDKKELSGLLLNLEKNVDRMPHELDEFQRKNYRFDVSAKIILGIMESSI